MNSITQFRYNIDRPTGLDYQALKIVADIMNIQLTPDVLSDIRVMESVFIEVKIPKANHG
jgi:hypothetical protein